MMRMTTSAGTRRQRWIWVGLLASTVLPSGVSAEVSAPARRPRFFVPDFRAVEGKGDATWVGLAVSEGLRYRLRRCGAATAVSGTRTAGVMQRMSGNDPLKPEEVARLARLLGADWSVMGLASPGSKGGFTLDLRVRQTRMGKQGRQRTVQGSSVHDLINGATDAVLALAGTALTDNQRQRIAGVPGGTDSAVEYYAKALRAVRAGKPTDALFYVAESRKYDPGFRPTMRLLGQINIAVGNQAEVLLIFEQLLRQAKKDNDPVDAIFAMTQIAIMHQRLNHLTIAEKYYQAALTQSRDVGLEDVQAVLYGAMATLRVDERKRGEALELLGKRLRLLEAQGDRLAMGPACLTIGLVHAARDEIDQALAYLNRAVKFAEETGIGQDKASALFQIGELYKEKNRLAEALKAYQASLEASEQRERGSAYRQIAEVYERQGEYEAALKMLRQAERVLSERKAYAQQANCLARIARIYAKRNDHAKAASTMSEAVEILTDLGHPELAKYRRELDEMRAKRQAP